MLKVVYNAFHILTLSIVLMNNSKILIAVTCHYSKLNIDSALKNTSIALNLLSLHYLNSLLALKKTVLDSKLLNIKKCFK